MKRIEILKKRKKTIFIVILLTIICLVGSWAIFRGYGEVATEIFLNTHNYDATAEINTALNNLKAENAPKAKIIKTASTDENVIALTFDGLTNKNTTESIVNLLKTYQMKGTFFVPGIKGAEDSEAVEAIVQGNQKIGNYTMTASKNIREFTQEDQVKDFCRTNVILKKITGTQPVILKCNITEYDDTLLESSYACNLSSVVQSSEYLNYQSLSSYEMALNYVKNLKKGSIVSLKMEGELDNSEYTRKQDPAIDKEPMNDIANTTITSEDEQLVVVVGWILKALKEVNYQTVYVDEIALSTKQTDSDNTNQQKNPGDISLNGGISSSSSIDPSKDKSNTIPDFPKLIGENNGELAAVTSYFYTSKEAVAFTFRGIGNEVALDDVLAELQNLGDAKATFFVTASEIEKYPERIKKIQSAGHEIGNGGVTADSKLESLSTEAICKEIYQCDVLLQKIGIETNYYMPGYGYTGGNIKEAVSVMSGYKSFDLITYSMSFIKTAYTGMTPEEIIEKNLPTNLYKSLRRGEIVYYRLDSTVFSDDTAVAELINKVANNYIYNGYVSVCKGLDDDGNSIYENTLKPLNYEVYTIGEMINTYEDITNAMVGRYSIQPESIEIEVGKIDETIANTMIYTNYIGNPSISGSKLKGFSDTTSVDIDGKIDTQGENVIFLTFDDWGSDPIIVSILNVLEKHQIKASFFAISKNLDIDQADLPDDQKVKINPNLLRAIALKGHDICSHNYNHMYIDIDDNEAEKELLAAEVVRSNKVLSKIVGDISQPQLIFRPPTLAISKSGLETVFKCGYRNVISGDFSTHDYAMTSAEELYNTLVYGKEKQKIGPGSIVIMHMNNQSGYTAEGLDMFLTENENKPEGERYEFALLSDYLN